MLFGVAHQPFDEIQNSAGMYFLGFPVYRLDPTSNLMGSIKDPDAAFFKKKLDGFQPCDNFFKSVSYTLEVGCTKAFVEEKESLRTVEAQILSKRLELSKFESDYKQVGSCTIHRDDR
ncbi:hypothetical protein L2E82_49006 [Cichorium intybus]|uniref:Uncharacterized protein n=1 Tax=Cichorium intybus TaxID=13427 RepID=A0ACB8Z0A9_CICIN|nr:hypothetical protein L2E82_49006 [Cichorium intybus]